MKKNETNDTLMLTDAEKQRILLEERYRHEVRSELAPVSRGSFWSFLNSTFGIWLFSAIFLSGAGTLYTKRQEARAEAAKDRETIERLDSEIANRFLQMQVRLHEIGKLEKTNHQALVTSVIESICKPPEGYLRHLYPEYSSYSMPALVENLRRWITDAAQRRDLGEIREHLITVSAFFEDKQVPLSDPERVAGVIRTNLILSRWKDAGGYFQHGSSQNSLQ